MRSPHSGPVRVDYTKTSTRQTARKTGRAWQYRVRGAVRWLRIGVTVQPDKHRPKRQAAVGAAVVALRREGPEVRLALTNGAEVAVPKNRRKAVLQWLEACPAVQAARSIGTKGNIDPDRAMM